MWESIANAAPLIVKNGAPYLLCFLLVIWIIRTLRAQYDARVAELRSHNAEVVSILKDQLGTSRLDSQTVSTLLANDQTVIRLIETALPKVAS